jgi:3-dehydrosphinganine reductase
MNWVRVLTGAMQTVLITGGSRGLGLNAGRQLAEKGAHVIIVARDAEVVQKGVNFISVCQSIS